MMESNRALSAGLFADQCPTGEITISDYKIPNGKYSGCSDLQIVKILQSVGIIGMNAFANCVGLTTVLIEGSGISEVGSGAFAGCTNLRTVTVNNEYCVENFKTIFPTHATIESITLGNLIEDTPGSIGILNFQGCSSLSKITIGNMISIISSYAFAGCSKLREVVFVDPPEVSTIGDYAFSECVSLVSITIPKKTTLIGIYAFQGCSSLTSVTVTGNLDTIGDNAFKDCASLSSFTYNSKKGPAIEQGKEAFAGCSELKVIEVPKDYEGETFVGFPVHKAGTKTEEEKNFGDFLLDNIEVFATCLTFLAGFIGVMLNWDSIMAKLKCCKKKNALSDQTDMTEDEKSEDDKYHYS